MKKRAIIFIVAVLIIIGLLDSYLMVYFQHNGDSVGTADGKTGTIIFIIGVLGLSILTIFYKIKMRQYRNTNKNNDRLGDHKDNND